MYLSWMEAKPVLGHPARTELKHPLPPVRLLETLHREGSPTLLSAAMDWTGLEPAGKQYRR